MNGIPPPAGKQSRGIMGYPTEQAEPFSAWNSTLPSLEITGTGCSIYIHIPFCRSRCCFCPFYYGNASKSEKHDYVELLAEELKQHSPLFRGLIINTVYFGGGTPSDLEPDEIALLTAILRQNYHLANDCEITLESRIDGLDGSRIGAALDGGINRFSLGVQTFDTKMQRSLDRVSDRKTVLDTLRDLTNRNAASITIDLLYGLPGQTESDLMEDLETILNETDLSGFSFYRLLTGRRAILMEKLNSGELPPIPDENTCESFYKLCEERMLAAGARHPSFKHYAFSPRERNLHNELSAWKNTMIPFGINASGRLGRYKFRQTGDLTEYRKMVKAGIKPLGYAGLLPEDFPVGAAIAGSLNCDLGIEPERILAKAPETVRGKLRTNLQNELKALEHEGFFTEEQYGGRRLTLKGRFRCAAAAERLMEAAARSWENDR